LDRIPVFAMVKCPATKSETLPVHGVEHAGELLVGDRRQTRSPREAALVGSFSSIRDYRTSPMYLAHMGGRTDSDPYQPLPMSLAQGGAGSVFSQPPPPMSLAQGGGLIQISTSPPPMSLAQGGLVRTPQRDPRFSERQE